MMRPLGEALTYRVLSPDLKVFASTRASINPHRPVEVIVKSIDDSSRGQKRAHGKQLHGYALSERVPIDAGREWTGHQEQHDATHEHPYVDHPALYAPPY